MYKIWKPVHFSTDLLYFAHWKTYLNNKAKGSAFEEIKTQHYIDVNKKFL